MSEKKKYELRHGDLVLFKNNKKYKDSGPDSTGKLSWAINGGKVREYPVKMYRNESDNENAPSNKGFADINGEGADIALWINEIPEGSNRPLYRGNMKFDGMVYSLSLWVKHSEKIGNYARGSVVTDPNAQYGAPRVDEYNRKQEVKTQETAKRQIISNDFDLDDEIPF